MTSSYQLLLSKSNVSISATTTLVDSDGVNGASTGDTIEYVIDLKNNGTTTLRNFAVFDEILDEQQQERWDQNQLLPQRASGPWHCCLLGFAYREHSLHRKLFTLTDPSPMIGRLLAIWNELPQIALVHDRLLIPPFLNWHIYMAVQRK